MNTMQKVQEEEERDKGHVMSRERDRPGSRQLVEELVTRNRRNTPVDVRIGDTLVSVFPLQCSGTEVRKRRPYRGAQEALVVWRIEGPFRSFRGPWCAGRS